MTHAATSALPAPPLVLRLDTSTTASIGDVRSLAASTAHYGVGAIELIFAGLLVPLTILAVGTPIVLVARGIIALITWLVLAA